MRSWQQYFGRAIRELVLGAEDGLVSIFGLVFGVAAGTDSSLIVLLAGATGALSGAVSMGAGHYLSVKSEVDVAERELAEEREQIRRYPARERAEIADFLHSHGFTREETARFLEAASRKPDFLLEEMAAHELHLGRATEQHPLRRALRIFAVYTLAAAFPVLPYALFPLRTATTVSLLATVAALVGVGLARAAVSHRQPLSTVAETLAVAALAAGAGFLVATLISGFAGVTLPAGA